MEYQNAIIEKADIGYEGHGILTISLVFKGKGWGQGLPGYRLDGGGPALSVRHARLVERAE